MQTQNPLSPPDAPPFFNLADTEDLRAHLEAQGRVLPAGTRIGPEAIYVPHLNRVEYSDCTWRPATAEDDARALQLLHFEELADAHGVDADGEVFLTFAPSPGDSCLGVKRVQDVRGLWCIAITRHKRRARTPRPIVLHVGTDLLSALDTLGAEMGDVHLRMSRSRVIDIADVDEAWGAVQAAA